MHALFQDFGQNLTELMCSQSSSFFVDITTSTTTATTTIPVLLLISLSLSIGFLVFVVHLTYREAQNVKLYEKRLSELEREMLPTTNMILGRASTSRHNSQSWHQTFGDEEDFGDLYETMPPQYRNRHV
jgi:hypothetical protein